MTTADKFYVTHRTSGETFEAKEDKVYCSIRKRWETQYMYRIARSDDTWRHCWQSTFAKLFKPMQLP